MNKQILLFVSLFLAYMVSMGQNTGSSCNDALTLLHEESTCGNYNLHSNTLWIEFTATTNFILVSVDLDYPIESLNLYSGTCGNLTSISNSTKSAIISSNLIINENYFISIQGSNSSISLSTKKYKFHYAGLWYIYFWWL